MPIILRFKEAQGLSNTISSLLHVANCMFVPELSGQQTFIYPPDVVQCTRERDEWWQYFPVLILEVILVGFLKKMLDYLVILWMVIWCLYRLRKSIGNPQETDTYIVIYSKLGGGVRLVPMLDCSLEHIINTRQKVQNYWSSASPQNEGKAPS